MKATIVVTAMNEEKYVAKALKALLSQTEKDFELIVVDDHSSDKTRKIIGSFKDKRLRLLVNKNNIGTERSRNKAIRQSRGKYIFFTDADAEVDKNWLKEGLHTFNKYNCKGVEGKTYYVSTKYEPTASDRTMSNLYGKAYIMANMAYTRKALFEVGLIREDAQEDIRGKMSYLSDRDTAFKILKLGKIRWCPKMLVTHQHTKWTPGGFLKSAKRISCRVIFYKEWGDRFGMVGRFLYLTDLIAVLCPPLVLASLFRQRYRTFNDLIYLVLLWPKLVYERITLWRTAIKEGVLLI